jgi:hypothetical protein
LVTNHFNTPKLKKALGVGSQKSKNVGSKPAHKTCYETVETELRKVTGVTPRHDFIDFLLKDASCFCWKNNRLEKSVALRDSARADWEGREG